MAPSYSHPKMFPFNLVLKDVYYIPKLIRTRPDVSIDDELLEATSSHMFHVVSLCTAVSHGCSVEAVRSYVEHYREEESDFKEMMHLATPVLYFAMGRNSPEMTSLLLKFGMSPHGPDDEAHFIPPLVFAAIHGYLQSLDMTEVIKILLATGADPRTVPEDMWENYLDMPQEAWPPTRGKKPAEIKWCDDLTRSYLARGLNLSQRYFLHRASLCEPLMEREVQLHELLEVTDLGKLPYRIIGQLPVLKTLQEIVFNQMSSNADGSDPLVMVFAGAPGHGKTELAQQLGDLLRLKHVTVACSQMETDTELLGSKQGYARSKEGSKLNNHLSHNNGLCSVVFLDEFDKTSQGVCESLLTLLSEGAYVDRRMNRDIDCSKTIWILACNLGDEAIASFHESKLAHKQEKDKLIADLEPLIGELRDAFKERWGDAFESRIDEVVPFFPFSPGEQAVMAHKFLLEKAARFRKDIDLRKE
ncbi:ClpA ATPase with chaperone activity ATP-binding subunit, partial [Pyrenophora tritici-repentis]